VIDRPVQISPVPFNLDIRLIDPPAVAGMAPGSAQPFLDLGCITLDLAIQGRVTHINTRFS